MGALANDIIEALASRSSERRGSSELSQLISILKYFDKRDKKGKDDKNKLLTKEEVEKLIKEKTEFKMPKLTVSQMIVLSPFVGIGTLYGIVYLANTAAELIHKLPH